SGNTYRLMYPQDKASSPALSLFRDWLLEQAQQYCQDRERSVQA
ncbi:MAG: LysR family transcriptional regulator, partial [Cytophaga sp.]|nr:LysR family transcriptional regulator [Undibacterium sp.]